MLPVSVANTTTTSNGGKEEFISTNTSRGSSIDNLRKTLARAPGKNSEGGSKAQAGGLQLTSLMRFMTSWSSYMSLVLPALLCSIRGFLFLNFNVKKNCVTKANISSKLEPGDLIKGSMLYTRH